MLFKLGAGAKPAGYPINLQDLGVPAFVVDVEDHGRFRYTFINNALVALTGLEPEALVGKTPGDTLPQDLAEVLAQQYGACARSGEPRTYVDEKQFADRYLYWQTTLSPVRDPRTGEVRQLIGAVLDMTERRRAELATKEASVRLSIAMQTLHGGFWHYDIATKSFETSPELTRLLAGADAGPLDLAGFTERIAEDDRPLADFSRLVDGTLDSHVAQYRVTVHTGQVRWLRCERRLVRDDKGRPVSLIGAAIDITEQHDATTLLTQEAMTDPLTGLTNRRGFDLLAARAEERRALTHTAIGILLVDLDRFKPVNDTYGHAAGDAVLKVVGERIREEVRPGDTVARLGGDEFAILVDDVTESTMALICERVARAISRPVEVEGARVQISASVGATMLGDRDHSVAQAQARADRALYSAKAKHSGWVLAN